MNRKRSPSRELLCRLLTTTLLVGLPVSVMAQEANQGQQAQDALELPEIRVEGSSYETDGSPSYTTNLISVGDKGVRPVREIPQSTTVITRQRIEDGNFTSLDTALRKTPGVVVLTNDDGRSSLYSRGFEFDTLMFNGLPAPLSSIYGTQPDMAIVDHVEILRGPAGLFGGSGEPAGAINLRLKQASKDFRGSVTGSAGTWPSYRIEGDVTGPLNQSGSLRGRLVGAYGAQDSWVDIVDNKVGIIYGTLQADITDDTTATLSIVHQKRDITPFNGLPTFANGRLISLNPSTFTGARWNDFENTVTDYLGEVEHRLEGGGHVKFSTRYSVRDGSFLYGYAANPASATGTVNGLRWLGRAFDETALAGDVHISKPFELFGLENNIILGFDSRTSRMAFDNATNLIAGTFNLFNWNANVPPPVVNYATRTSTDPNESGLYGQWRIKPIDRLTLIAGGRLSWYDASSTAVTYATGARTTSKVDIGQEFTPYGGIVFDLTDKTSAYASYTKIFQPQSVTDISGGIIKPRTGRQFELGLKSELFTGVNASAAYFDLEDENRAVSDPSNPGYYLAQGKAKIRGVELEATGAITPNWSITGGYTYTDTEFVGTRTAAGAEFYTPKHMLQLWNKYTFDSRHGFLDGAFFGVGIKAFSSFKNLSRTAAGGVSSIDAPGYAVVDLTAGYKINDHLTASVNVSNLFDKKYYERVGGTSVFNFYGEPRSATVKLQATF